MSLLSIRYAEFWTLENISEELTKTNYSILTKINEKLGEKILNMPNIKKINLISIVDFHMSKNISNNELIEKYNGSDVYDQNLNIILNKYAINHFFKNMININHYKNDNNHDDDRIGILAGGISDMKLLVLGFIICTINNIPTYLKTNLGINNIENILSNAHEIKNNKLNIVIAGMENSLTHLIANITNTLILCVPSSCSYGYGNQNSSMLSLLNSKKIGVIIFNTDNIYGASIYANNLINYKKKYFPYNYSYMFRYSTIYEKDDGIQLKNILYSSKKYFDTELERYDLIFVREKTGSFANFITSIIKQNNSIIPVIGLSSNNNIHKVILSGCLQYGVAIDDAENIKKILEKFKVFFNTETYESYQDDITIWIIVFIISLIIYILEIYFNKVQL